MDFRKADPTYTKFKPATAEDAINKFYRHKNLGVPPHLWPEVFVNCAATLPDEELHKFQDWLVNPQGEPTGPMLMQLDEDNERLRKQLLKEAQARDKPPTIDEHCDLGLRSKILPKYMDVDDEKCRGYGDDEKMQPPLEPPELTLGTPPSTLQSMMGSCTLENHDFEMVTPSER